jgi:hypothetical protein
MDPFKRSTMLSAQAALGQITSDEIRTEMQTLMPLMQADPEAQPDPPAQTSDQQPQGFSQPGY